MNKKYLTFSILISLLFACNTKPDMKPLSLLDYGVPLTIMVPDSARVKYKKLSVDEDLTIQGKPNYKLQIFISETTTTSPSKVLEEQKELVQQNPYFSKITDEDAEGFIFESKIDSTETFGFRRVKIMGNKEIIFREALLGTFSKQDIETMYHSVEGVKRKK